MLLGAGNKYCYLLTYLLTNKQVIHKSAVEELDKDLFRCEVLEEQHRTQTFAHLVVCHTRLFQTTTTTLYMTPQLRRYTQAANSSRADVNVNVTAFMYHAGLITQL